MRRTAVVDFDNTLSGYDRWRGPNVLGPPIPYALDAIRELIEWGWRVVVFTTRKDTAKISEWLTKNGFPLLYINDTSHNPQDTSSKPIGEVYFDDRDAHCVGQIPYNWHNAMQRVRKKYQPSLTVEVDDASAWASWLNAIRAYFVRREYANDLPVLLDAEQARVNGRPDVANQIERGLHEWKIREGL